MNKRINKIESYLSNYSDITPTLRFLEMVKNNPDAKITYSHVESNDLKKQTSVLFLCKEIKLENLGDRPKNSYKIFASGGKILYCIDSIELSKFNEMMDFVNSKHEILNEIKREVPEVFI